MIYSCSFLSLIACGKRSNLCRDGRYTKSMDTTVCLPEHVNKIKAYLDSKLGRFYHLKAIQAHGCNLAFNNLSSNMDEQSKVNNTHDTDTFCYYMVYLWCEFQLM